MVRFHNTHEGYTNVAVPLPDGAVSCRIVIISKYSDDAEANRRSKQPPTLSVDGSKQAAGKKVTRS